jgi:hypothetical protein
LLWAVSIMSCTEPIEAPSAYAGERFLCEEQDAAQFEALVTDCRRRADLRAGSCIGVASLKVDFLAQHAVVDSDLTAADYGPDPRDPVMRSSAATGSSPYFNYRLSLGLTTDSLTAEGVTAQADEACRRPGAGSATASFDVRGSSDTLAFGLTSCEVNARDGIRLRYSGTIVRGGSVDVCVFMHPTRDVVPRALIGDSRADD